MTPEGKIKAAIDKVLDKYIDAGAPLYYEKWVPSGYGKKGLDYNITCAGHTVIVEAKAPGEWLTGYQRQTALKHMGALAKVLCVSSPEGLRALDRCLLKLLDALNQPLIIAVDPGKTFDIENYRFDDLYPWKRWHVKAAD